ncbi:unnamed protein product [Pieris brassicae]|uniref:TGF-beta propeptide domain-containing protein n=1 Tax=Pieris brassicae TaxID=7116 RepID=A0A9P0TWH2_PIEBR|nr:unnamed protein product [Pieris brassicae]
MYFLLCLLVFIKAETQEASRESETTPVLFVKEISKESLRNEILRHMLGIDSYSLAKELRSYDDPYPNDDVDKTALRKIESDIKSLIHDKQFQNNELRTKQHTNVMGKQQAISDKMKYGILRKRKPPAKPNKKQKLWFSVIYRVRQDRLSSKGSKVSRDEELRQLNVLIIAESHQTEYITLDVEDPFHFEPEVKDSQDMLAIDKYKANELKQIGSDSNEHEPQDKTFRRIELAVANYICRQQRESRNKMVERTKGNKKNKKLKKFFPVKKLNHNKNVVEDEFMELNELLQYTQRFIF